MVSNLKSLKISSCGISDIGLVRTNNEDFWEIVPEVRFYVLADGMGGHQAGEIAAKETVQELCKTIKETFKSSKKAPTLLDSHRIIRQAIQQVNLHVYNMSLAQESLEGMGTTLCAALIHESGLVYAHVGDSRIYRFRNQHLQLLTKDHSLISDLMDFGQIGEIRPNECTFKNVLTKAVGTERSIEPSVHVTDILPNDTFMLCSDGLTDMLNRKEMEGCFQSFLSIEETAQNLVKKAKEKGGVDNITVVLIHVEKNENPQDLS